MNKTKIDNQTIAHILLDLRPSSFPGTACSNIRRYSSGRIAMGNGNLCSKHPYPALNQ